MDESVLGVEELITDGQAVQEVQLDVAARPQGFGEVTAYGSGVLAFRLKGEPTVLIRTVLVWMQREPGVLSIEDEPGYVIYVRTVHTAEWLRWLRGHHPYAERHLADGHPVTPAAGVVTVAQPTPRLDPDPERAQPASTTPDGGPPLAERLAAARARAVRLPARVMATDEAAEFIQPLLGPADSLLRNGLAQFVPQGARRGEGEGRIFVTAFAFWFWRDGDTSPMFVLPWVTRAGRLEVSGRRIIMPTFRQLDVTVHAISEGKPFTDVLPFYANKSLAKWLEANAMHLGI